MTKYPVGKEFVDANGLVFETDQCGDGNRLALFLHGFPEHSFSWRYQLPLFAELGYRAWAPNMRGYGNSSSPHKVKDYAIELLMADVAGLIDASGSKEVILIARVSSLMAGIPITAAAYTVNQYCNAGLRAINAAAHQMMIGDGDACVCAGVEIMSHYAMGSDIQVAVDAQYPVRLSVKLLDTGIAVPQGLCAEMISEDKGHTRELLDRAGAISMKHAVEAQQPSS